MVETNVPAHVIHACASVKRANEWVTDSRAQLPFGSDATQSRDPRRATLRREVTVMAGFQKRVGFKGESGYKSPPIV